MADLVPYDVALSKEDDRKLRRRIRDALRAECDDDLFSMNAVRRVEQLTTAFLAEIGEAGRPARY